MTASICLYNKDYELMPWYMNFMNHVGMTSGGISSVSRDAELDKHGAVLVVDERLWQSCLVFDTDEQKTLFLLRFS